MREAQGVLRYDDGYREGRAACLITGSSATARILLEARRDRDGAFDAGFEWALWDYDDANGLGSTKIVRPA